MTFVEVLDSAIKIGLGAMITGFTALLLTTRNHYHNMRSVRLETEINLFRESINLFDEASSLANKFAGSIANDEAMKNLEDPLEKTGTEADETRMNLLREAINSALKARTLSHLAGRREIGELMADYVKSLDALHDAYGQRGSLLPNDFLSMNADMRMESARQILNRLRADFEGFFT